LLLLLLLIPLSIYMGRTFWKWKTTPVDARAHGWRAYLGLIAFALASASIVLFFYTGVRARVHGGFPYYAPMLLRLLKTGFALGVSGLLLGLPSKGSLRWPTVISSFIMAALWVIVATSE
jgi:hypothetical protein